MVDKSKRGTKLKCQNEDCAPSYYDLNMVQPNCPTCGTAYDHEAALELVSPEPKFGRRRQTPVLNIVAPEEPTETATEEADDYASDQILEIDADDADSTTDRSKGSLAD